ncbi:MAG: DUF1800 domain-containing protein [Candidatus Eremiobacteraeota bacterium]|nr:DUF1800 domain-containing protein [Candidatus Eremiobacteraeota bacterium]MBC5826530.1 DUF1800 domain-containing protein [Candidatus Eremiobacteraeota bacterium]
MSSNNAPAGPSAQRRPAGHLDVRTALRPYRGAWNAGLAAHLLRRAGFGGSPQEIGRAAAAGMDAAVDSLLRFSVTSLPDAPEGDFSFSAAMPQQRRAAVIAAQLWWLNRLLLSPNPLQEKMVYFWANHFTSAIGGGVTPAMMVQQYGLFRRYALGDYSQLTHEISKDPAMLVYLNGAQNHNGRPNENYARELMELFTMGIGNYSEEDVRQSARAFTGYTVRRLDGSAHYEARLHDDGDKTFLNRSGRFSGDDIVDIIMQQPATGRYMATKFLRAFVYDDPEPELVDAVASLFRTNYDVGTLLDTLLRSDVFYSARAYRALIKSPLDLAIGALKSVGAAAVGPAVDGALVRMGQTVMYPPNVAGWPGGSQWMSQSTLLARLNFLNGLVYYKPTGSAAASATSMDSMPKGRHAGMVSGIADPLTWIAGARIDDPGDVAEHVLRSTLQDDATPQQRSTLLGYLQTDAVGNLVALNAENIDEKVRGAAALAFAMPAYQLM